MSTSYRVLAIVGILILAASGCQKGSKSTARGPKKEDVLKSASKNVKAGSSASRSTGKGSEDRHAKETATSRAGGRVGSLTAEDNGRDIDLRQGQIVTVVLDSNKASGLGWVLIEPNGPVIVSQGSPVYTSRSGKRSSGGIETWHFRAAKPGHQTVRLEYRRKWAQSVPEKTFRFNGDVR